MTSNNIKEWLSEAEQAAKDYQEDCIDTIVTDINWELMSNDYEFEDHYIGEHIHEYCETKVIYTSDCKKIIDELSAKLIDQVRIIAELEKEIERLVAENKK